MTSNKLLIHSATSTTYLLLKHVYLLNILRILDNVRLMKGVSFVEKNQVHQEIQTWDGATLIIVFTHTGSEIF